MYTFYFLNKVKNKKVIQQIQIRNKKSENKKWKRLCPDWSDLQPDSSKSYLIPNFISFFSTFHMHFLRFVSENNKAWSLFNQQATICSTAVINSIEQADVTLLRSLPDRFQVDLNKKMHSYFSYSSVWVTTLLDDKQTTCCSWPPSNNSLIDQSRCTCAHQRSQRETTAPFIKRKRHRSGRQQVMKRCDDALDCIIL